MTLLLRPYAELLKPRRHWSLLLAGLFARVPSAILGFSTLLLVQSTTRSFTTGGLVAGTFVATTAIVGPVYGRLADRHGQRIILRIAPFVHAASVISLVLLAEARVSPAVLVALAVVVGGSLAPIGSFTRARWSHIFGGLAGIRTAFAVESILDDLSWIVGPAISAYLSVTVNPMSGLFLSAACGLTGGVLLSFQRATDTIPLPRAHRAPRFNPFASRAVLTVMAAGLFVGLSFGINDISAIGITSEDGIPQDAGFILAVFSIGSLVGGAIIGAWRERGTPFGMFLIASAYLAITWVPLAFAPTTLWIMICGPLAGTSAAFFTISANRLVESSVDRAFVTEALAWVTASIVAGMSGGSLVGGMVIDNFGARGGFACVTALMLFPVVLVAIGSPRYGRIYSHGDVR